MSARPAGAGRGFVAVAPSRIDLAGGTLDIWPLHCLIDGCVTVNLGIDLPARVEVRPRQDGKLQIVSKDRRARVTRKLPLSSKALEHPLSLLLRLAADSGPVDGVEMHTQASAPAGAGLGGSSTLAVAALAALDRLAGRGISKPRLLRRVINLEAAEIGIPTGNQDYLAALHGGLAAYHHTPDGPRREALPIEPSFVDRLVLAYTGRPRQSGFSNWDMFRRFIDGERRTVTAMREIARIATELTEALQRRDVDACAQLVVEEGALRLRLAPSVASPEIRAVSQAARRAGALGTKVCGAGGGGCLVAVAKPGRREAVAEAIRRAGAEVLPLKPSRRGVRVRPLDGAD